jgi:REP element-mobilizing transposase RayT
MLGAIPSHFPFVLLDAFVIMPNHVHGILLIDKPVETQHLASLPPPQNRFGPQSQNLASIIRGFKIGVTKYANQHQITFAWQSRYHDHVIRNTGDYDRIRQYVAENPQKWSADTFYSSLEDRLSH